MPIQKYPKFPPPTPTPSRESGTPDLLHLFPSQQESCHNVRRRLAQYFQAITACLLKYPGVAKQANSIGSPQAVRLLTISNPTMRVPKQQLGSAHREGKNEMGEKLEPMNPHRDLSQRHLLHMWGRRFHSRLNWAGFSQSFQMVTERICLDQEKAPGSCLAEEHGAWGHHIADSVKSQLPGIGKEVMSI